MMIFSMLSWGKEQIVLTATKGKAQIDFVEAIKSLNEK